MFNFSLSIKRGFSAFMPANQNKPLLKKPSMMVYIGLFKEITSRGLDIQGLSLSIGSLVIVVNLFCEQEVSLLLYIFFLFWADNRSLKLEYQNLTIPELIHVAEKARRSKTNITTFFYAF